MNRTSNTAKNRSNEAENTESENSGVITADEYLDAEELWNNHGNKIITACVLVVIGVWFIKEYRTTQNQLVMDAASTYTQVKDNLLPVLTSSSKEEQKDLEVFRNAIQELNTDYKGTVYQKSALLSEAARSLVSADHDAVINTLSPLVASSDKGGFTLSYIADEIAVLLKARALLAKEPSQGITLLTSLIDSGSILSPEALSSLAVFETNADVWGSGGKTEFIKSQFEVIQNKNPRVAEYSVRQLAQLGIFIDGISN